MDTEEFRRAAGDLGRRAHFPGGTHSGDRSSLFVYENGKAFPAVETTGKKLKKPKSIAFGQ